MKQQVVDALKPVIRQGLVSGGAALGGVAGSYIPGGAAVGAKVGSSIGAKVSKLIGSGDYAVTNSVKHNSLIGQTPAMPSEFANDPHCVRIRRREYVGDIVSGTANTFNLQSFAINPGLSTSFPYLSRMASLYEEYMFSGLVYEFVSTTSPYLAGGAMGAVIMAAEYNPYGSPWTTKIGMENSDFAISARPDQNMLYGFECAPQGNTQNSYYVRSGSSSAPLNATDIGTFYVAHQTPIAAGQTLGELWIVYDVVFKRPYITVAGIVTNTLFSHIQNQNWNPSQTTLGSFLVRSSSNLTAVASIPVSGTLRVTVSGATIYDVFSITQSFLGSAVPTVALTGNNATNLSGAVLINGPGNQGNVIAPNTAASALIVNHCSTTTMQCNSFTGTFSFDYVTANTSTTLGVLDLFINRLSSPGSAVTLV